VKKARFIAYSASFDSVALRGELASSVIRTERRATGNVEGLRDDLKNAH
jgi:hypothetical protein